MGGFHLSHSADAVPVLLSAARSCMTEDRDQNARLTECLNTVRKLEEENRHLRRAAASFGQLAERLNKQLGRDRRVADRDRRREPRETIERRSQAQPQ